MRRKVEPDDLFQETSAEAVRSLPEVQLGDRDPFNWLCQVAERRIIDAHRRFFGQKRDAAREDRGPRDIQSHEAIGRDEKELRTLGDIAWRRALTAERFESSHGCLWRRSGFEPRERVSLLPVCPSG